MPRLNCRKINQKSQTREKSANSMGLLMTTLLTMTVDPVDLEDRVKQKDEPKLIKQILRMF